MQSYAYFANVVCLFVANSSLFGSFSRFSHNEFPKVDLPERCRGLDGLHGEALVAIAVDGCDGIVELPSVVTDGDLVAALTGADEIAGIGDVDRIVARGVYIINKVVGAGMVARGLPGDHIRFHAPLETDSWRC